MQILVNVLAVTPPVSKTDKNGKPYSEIEVVYRDNGETRNKKLNTYGKAVYSTFVNAKPGEVFTVEMEKKGDYWNWNKATRGVAEAAASGDAPAATAAAVAVPTKWKERDYESKDERALKQIYIVKQSSLSNAVATLTPGSKGIDPDAVLALAQRYTDWVLEKPEPEEVGQPTFHDDVDSLQ
jgi:hypothetical protein